MGIYEIKTERTQIHFLSDVLVAVASLDLKVPTGYFISLSLVTPRSLYERYLLVSKVANTLLQS